MTESGNVSVRPVRAMWHVRVNGEWMAITHAGYGPVNVTVNGRMQPVEFRHVGGDCMRTSCAGLPMRP